MKTNCIVVIAITIFTSASSHADPRTSANYIVATDTTDSGGKRSTSVQYTNDGSMGGIVGITTVAAPAETLKAGYTAQLYDATGLTLVASPLTVNENSTLQLTALLTLDDLTFLAVSSGSVAWSVASGPLSLSNGLATAGVVYQNTAATAQGIYLGFTGSLGLTVVNSISDNFGAYAGDSLNDDWQVQYFGENNPDAAPTLDPDGDTYTNAFEFTAGLVPIDNASRFFLSTNPVSNQPTQRKIVFYPIIAGRNYTIESSSFLSNGSWAPLASFTQSDNGNERTVIDTNAIEPRKFYRVKVEKP